METEIIKGTLGLGQYGIVGVIILSFTMVAGVFYMAMRHSERESQVNREFLSEQGELNREETKLNREAHKDSSRLITEAFKESTMTMVAFAKDNRDDHYKIHEHLAEIKTKLKR